MMLPPTCDRSVHSLSENMQAQWSPVPSYVHAKFCTCHCETTSNQNMLPFIPATKSFSLIKVAVSQSCLQAMLTEMLKFCDNTEIDWLSPQRIKFKLTLMVIRNAVNVVLYHCVDLWSDIWLWCPQLIPEQVQKNIWKI